MARAFLPLPESQPGGLGCTGGGSAPHIRSFIGAFNFHVQLNQAAGASSSPHNLEKQTGQAIRHTHSRHTFFGDSFLYALHIADMSYIPRRDFDKGGRGGGGGGGGGGDDGGYDGFMKAKGRRTCKTRPSFFSTLTRSPVAGPVTDYGATTTHWMRHRQPKYKGGYRGDLERPSPSYLINVSSHESLVMRWHSFVTADASSGCKDDQRGGFGSRPLGPPITQQSQASSQCRAMDARGPTSVDRV